MWIYFFDLNHKPLQLLLCLRPKTQEVTYFCSKPGDVKPMTVNTITDLLKLQLTVSELGETELYKAEKSIKELHYNPTIPN
jgi:hypothetical protein